MRKANFVEVLKNLRNLLTLEQEIIRSFLKSRENRENISRKRVGEFKKIQAQKKNLLIELAKYPIGSSSVEIKQILNEIKQLILTNSSMMKELYPKSIALSLLLFPGS